MILDAAQRILRAEGLEAVTMRRIAGELDTGAASLYVYISGRDELRQALLRAGGIRDRDAAWAVDTLPLITTASAIEAGVFQEQAAGEGPENEDELRERLTAAFAALPAERFPNITGLSAELTSGDGAERFRFAIELVLDGLVARSRAAG